MIKFLYKNNVNFVYGNQSKSLGSDVFSDLNINSNQNRTKYIFLINRTDRRASWYSLKHVDVKCMFYL